MLLSVIPGISLLDEVEGRVEKFAYNRELVVLASDCVDEANEVEDEAYNKEDSSYDGEKADVLQNVA